MGVECMTAIIALTVGFLGLTAMLRNYKAKFDEKSITLEKHDKDNDQRIKSLEKQIIDLKQIILEKNKYDTKQ